MTGIVRFCPEMAGSGTLLVQDGRWSFWGLVGVFLEFPAKNSNNLSARHPGFAASDVEG
jgi:hypothetical protein